MPRAPKYTPVAAPALAQSPPNLFVGTSGWSYSTWKPGFYPADVPSRAFLHHYATHFTAVEVNFTFRELPTKEQLRGWLDAAPPGFRFCFKAPQQITHFQRLIECHDAVREFVAAIKPAAHAAKLGPLLFQLPPNFVANHEKLAHLLSATAFRGRPSRLPLALEFRHPSWFSEKTYSILRRYSAALCVAESDEFVTPDVQTAPFRYYRLRCDGSYSPQRLKGFAQRFAAMAANNPAFVFFKHEDEPTGALNALELIRYANNVSLSAEELPA